MVSDSKGCHPLRKAAKYACSDWKEIFLKFRSHFFLYQNLLTSFSLCLWCTRSDTEFACTDNFHEHSCKSHYDHGNNFPFRTHQCPDSYDCPNLCDNLLGSYIGTTPVYSRKFQCTDYTIYALRIRRYRRRCDCYSLADSPSRKHNDTIPRNWYNAERIVLECQYIHRYPHRLCRPRGSSWNRRCTHSDTNQRCSCTRCSPGRLVPCKTHIRRCLRNDYL